MTDSERQTAWRVCAHEAGHALAAMKTVGGRGFVAYDYASAIEAGESLEMQNQCAEIKLRAERRAGEILLEGERAEPSDTLLRGRIVQPREAPTLADLAVSDGRGARAPIPRPLRAGLCAGPRPRR